MANHSPKVPADPANLPSGKVTSSFGKICLHLFIVFANLLWAYPVGIRVLIWINSILPSGWSLFHPIVIAFNFIGFMPIGILVIWFGTRWKFANKIRWSEVVLFFSSLQIMANISQDLQYLKEAHQYWEEGNKTKATERYMLLIESSGHVLIPKDERPKVFKKIIEHQLSIGKIADARKVMLKASEKKIGLNLDNERYSNILQGINDQRENTHYQKSNSSIGSTLSFQINSNTTQDQISELRTKITNWQEKGKKLGDLIASIENDRKSLLLKLDILSKSGKDDTVSNPQIAIISKELLDINQQSKALKVKQSEYELAVAKSESTLRGIERQIAASEAGVSDAELMELTRTMLELDENLNAKDRLDSVLSELDETVATQLSEYRQIKEEQSEKLKNDIKKEIDAMAFNQGLSSENKKNPNPEEDKHQQVESNTVEKPLSKPDPIQEEKKMPHPSHPKTEKTSTQESIKPSKKQKPKDPEEIIRIGKGAISVSVEVINPGVLKFTYKGRGFEANPNEYNEWLENKGVEYLKARIKKMKMDQGAWDLTTERTVVGTMVVDVVTATKR
jgi:hypothetical protein